MNGTMNDAGTKEFYTAFVKIIGSGNNSSAMASYTNANYRIRSLCMTLDKLASLEVFKSINIYNFSDRAYLKSENIELLTSFICALYQRMYLEGIPLYGGMQHYQLLDWHESGFKPSSPNAHFMPLWGECSEKALPIESINLKGIRFYIDGRTVNKHPDGTVVTREGKRLENVISLSPMEMEISDCPGLLELYWMRTLPDSLQSTVNEAGLGVSSKDLFNKIYNEVSSGGVEEHLMEHLKATLHLFERAFESKNS